MFQNVDFTEFKGIKKCEKPIELAKFTLLIGPNNAGKTSILEGIFFLPTPWNFSMPFIDKTRLDIFSMIHKNTESLVYCYSGKATIRVELEGKPIELNVYPNGSFKVVILGKQYDDLSSIAALLRGNSSSEVSNQLLTYTVYIPNNSQFIEVLADAINRHWYDVVKTNAHVRAVKEIIAGTITDRFTEVLINHRGDLVVRKETLKEGYYVHYVKFRDVGEGIKRLLPAILWLETVKPKVVLWDDLEVATHPALINSMLRWLTSGDWQVIATTHSIDVLNSFVELDPKDGRVIQLWKTQDDILHWKSLSIEELEKLFESGQDVRKLFRW